MNFDQINLLHATLKFPVDASFCCIGCITITNPATGNLLTSSLHTNDVFIHGMCPGFLLIFSLLQHRSENTDYSDK